MKRLLAAIFMASAAAAPAHATSVAFNSPLANTVVATTAAYVLDMSSNSVDLLSVQANISSVTAQSTAFTDGHISTGTFTVVSTSALVATASSDTITVATNSALSPTQGSDSILVSSDSTNLSGSSITLVTASSVTTSFGVGISSNVVSTTQTAVSIAAYINSNIENVTATVSGSSVIVTCNAAGRACNNYAMSATSTHLSVASANFTGGNDNASFTLAGHVFYQGLDWTAGNTSSATAISIAQAIDNLAAYVGSTMTTTEVLVQCASSGSFCNGTTLTASTGALTISNPALVGGLDNAVIAVNGVKLTQGTDWTVFGSSVQVSTAIVAAINANSSLSGIVKAAAATAGANVGIVYASGTIVTAGSNLYTLYSSTAGITASSSTLLNGATANYALNGTSIFIPGHGYATNLQVKFSTSSGVALGGLTNQTTYYAINIDANHIGLASTSTGAVAGTFITLTSTPAIGGDNFSLTPVPMSGTSFIILQGSNDNSNWSNLNVSSITFASPYTATSTLWDLGAVNFRYFRADVLGPSAGEDSIYIFGFGKRYGQGL